MEENSRKICRRDLRIAEILRILSDSDKLDDIIINMVYAILHGVQN